MTPLINRREMLRRTGMGFGTLALANLIGNKTARVAQAEPSASSLAPKSPHYEPRVKRVIHLFMNGGPSQIDTFDPKPELEKYHGKYIDEKLKRSQRLGGVAHASPFSFAKYGQSGIEVSELFPHLAQCVDDICLIRSMVTDIPNHEPGLLMMNAGHIILPRPSIGSWVLYGLGSENQSLPGYIVMCPTGLPTAASGNWRNAFLPGIFQGTYVDSQYTDPEDLVANIQNNYIVSDQQRRQLNFVQALNRQHRENRPGDGQLDARIQSLELAFRMQTEASDAFDVAREPKNIREMYGDNVQGRQMLIARRLAERGVRYIQVYHGKGQPWDSHQDIEGSHRRLAKDSDQAVAALLIDLKRSGMLDETLLIWGGEMGRTPTVQLPVGKKPGRDHHSEGFSIWLAGGGIKAGHIHGRTDEFGLNVVEDSMHVHDLHATILHLLGFDHQQLTYRYAGRDFSLTDIHGRVVHEILA